MPVLNILYYIALILFIFMTFIIIRNYFRSKFDKEGRRTDMLGKDEKRE